jgi:hypothetical protein
MSAAIKNVTNFRYYAITFYAYLCGFQKNKKIINITYYFNFKQNIRNFEQVTKYI